MGKQGVPANDQGLRQRAEASLTHGAEREHGSTGEAEALKLVHELRVHQIELALQNEELRRAASENEAVLRQVRDLYDFAPVGYLTLGTDGRIRQANLVGAALLGRDGGDLLGVPLESFVALDGRCALSRFLARTATRGPGAGTRAEQELNLVRRDGTVRTVLVQGVRAEGAAECRVTMTDISARKDSEEQLKLAALVYQAIGEAIMVTDAANRIIAVNEAFSDLTGYTAAEAIGRSSSLLRSGRQDAQFYQEMWHALNTTGRWQGEILNRRKSGAVFAEWLVINTIHDATGAVLRRVAMFSDITERKRAEATIWRQANYDPLTGLPNRNLFRDRLQQDIKNLRSGDETLALMFIDLDNFKEVNDSLGHSRGDQLLIEAARRIGSCVRDGDTVARLGGDEFTIILANVADPLRIEQVAQTILQEIARPYPLDGDRAHVSGSIGITLFPNDAADIESLLKNADQAMYEAKAQGRNRYCYFTAVMQQAAMARLQLANDLRGALAAGQLMVYYQPIVQLPGQRCVKAEALLRWWHPQRGLVGPGEFIPLAEQIGIIGELGDWVFRQATGEVTKWIAMDVGCTQVSVNKSPRQFASSSAQLDWFDHLRAAGLPPFCVNVEITEGLLLDARPDVTGGLLRLHEAGVQISLDDFGTGYSAMSYLKKFPIDYLKIDQSFVRDMVTDASDQAIVEAIIVMAHKLGMKVVAEGVETVAQRDLLTAAGCDFAQGYLFARPLPKEDFLAYLREDAVA